MKLLVEGINDYEVLEEASNSGGKSYAIRGVFMQAETTNRNGRYYPKDILLREANRYIENYVNRQCAYGELDHPSCFTDSAEALTETGWKKIKDISVGERVFTLNPATKQTELQSVEHVHIGPYKGDMIRLKTRSFDTTVTPNHRFLAYYRDGQPHFLTAQEIKDGLDQGIARLAKFAIPKASEADNLSEPETFTIGETTLPLKDFAEFLGLYLAEGYSEKRAGYGRKNSYKLSIFQNEGPKADRIRELIKKLPWNISERVRDSKVVWTCHDRTLCEYVYPLGKAWEKYIPQDFLTVIGKKSSIAFFDYYHLGDGRGSFDNINRQVEVFSTSERLRDDVSVVVSKMGLPCRTFTYIEENDVVIENRVIKAENKRPLHFLKVLKADNVWLDKRHMTAEYVPHDGDVYCLTVPNQVFLVRDNEYTFWSGNSPIVSLKNASHIITELKTEGNDFIGKAKILNTDAGKTAQALIEAGCKLGVSSRGLGSLQTTDRGYSLVKEDFHLVTPADLVADPSAPKAFVDSLMENAEWVYLENVGWTQRFVDEAKKTIRKTPKKNLEEVQMKLFENFMSNLRSDYL